MVSRKFSPTRVTCAETNVASLASGHAEDPVSRSQPACRRRPPPSGRRWPAARLSRTVLTANAGLSLRARRRRQSRRRQPVGVKAQVGGPHPIEHHAADDEKRNGDADLHERRHAMHANGLASAAAGILLQRVNQVGTAEADGRQQPEEHADQQAQSGRDRDPGRVEIDLRRNRHAQLPADDGRNAEQHKRADRAGGKRQQHRFEEEIADEAAAGPHRAPRESTARARGWRRGPASCPRCSGTRPGAPCRRGPA